MASNIFFVFRHFRKFLAASLAIFAFISNGLANNLSNAYEETLRSFTACDDRFFQSLQQHAAKWNKVIPLKTNGKVSWIQVPNRKAVYINNGDHTINFDIPPATRVHFSKPLTIAGMQIASYFDEFIDVGEGGLIYFWGFSIKGIAEEVAQKLRPLLSTPERLQLENTVYSRVEARYISPNMGSEWFPYADNNTVTGRDKIERLLAIEKDEKQPGNVRLNCSIQGGISADFLREARPDIALADYPPQLSPTLFDDIPIHPKAAIEVSVLLNQANTSWMRPNFNKINFTVVSKTEKDKKETAVTYLLNKTSDGFIRSREIYSRYYNVQRLLFFGILPLKVLQNRQENDHVSLTQDLKVSLPSTVAIGEKLAMDVLWAQSPENASSKWRTWSANCEISKIYDANTLWPSLTGRAIEMACVYNHGTPVEYTQNIALLEDLGIAIPLNGKSVTGDLYSNKITRFSLE